MASLKIVLRKNQNKDNTYPLVIRITKNRKTRYISLGHSVLLEDWNPTAQRVKKSHPNSTRLNNLLIKKLAEANDKVIELETSSKDTSVQVIGKAVKHQKEGTFFRQAEIYLDNLKKEGKFNRLSNDKPKIARLREYIGYDANFTEIDTNLLKGFKSSLKLKRGITERSAVNHLVVIRSIYNQAIAANLVERKYYPFGKGKIIIKFPDSNKIGLTPEEVHALETVELSPQENHARNLWLFSFYLAGMRVSDVLRLKWSDFHGDRLYYAMGKNDKAGSLKVPEKAMQILESYRRDSVLVFQDLEIVDDLTNKFKVQHRIKSRVHEINKYLGQAAIKADIKKHLTMHISRHTFAQLAGDKIPAQILQKLYRHSSITTTMAYQGHFSNDKTDNALDAVLDF